MGEPQWPLCLKGEDFPRLSLFKANSARSKLGGYQCRVHVRKPPKP